MLGQANVTAFSAQTQMAAIPLNFMRGLQRFREQLFHLEVPFADALLIGILQESLERLAVRLDAVGEIILAQQLHSLARIFIAPRDREQRYRAVERAGDGAPFRFLESDEQFACD